MVPSLCVVIPCLNEEKAIAAVVAEFRGEFPDARILVVDNGSTDRTASLARESGADVITERRRGKAQAIITALQQIDTDLVLMVDGDASYPAAGARILFDLHAREPADMITGIRVADPNDAASFRPMHQAGTRAFARGLGLAFGYTPGDLFSGLRLFSRRFYSNVPILARGFELELEFTVQAIDKGFSVSEVVVPFRQRALGSYSKLRTVRDGLHILRFLVVLFRDYKPVAFFGLIALAFCAAGLLAGVRPISDYVTTARVAHFPLAFLAASLEVIAFLTLQTGVVLECSLRYAREAFQVRVRQFEHSRRGR